MNYDAIGYRIHAPGEPLETLLDPRRPDGWVASDESYEAQPLGVSCCASIADLMAYARHYSMSALPGSLLVELRGKWSPESDRDEYAQRIIVESYRVLGRGDRLVRAALNPRVVPGAGAE